MGLSSELPCEAGRISCCRNPHRCFQSEALRLYFPILEPLVAWSISLPSCSSQFICIQMWDLPVHSLAASPLCPGCLYPPLLPVWMNVSSLTSWLLDFHTVWFSGSSGYILFLNLLLSFFRLYEEAKCIYLCLHLGPKTHVMKLYNVPGMPSFTISSCLGICSLEEKHHHKHRRIVVISSIIFHFWFDYVWLHG